MKGDRLLLFLGILCLSYWLLDFANVVFLVRKPQYMLWYSSFGLLLTSIALIKRNPTFISIMFCALFVAESMWVLDFLGKSFLNNSFFGVTNYLFKPSYVRRDFIMAMYHLFIPPVLLISIFQTKKVSKYSWVGATFYASAITALTFFLVPKTETVNCVHQVSRCEGLFSFAFTPIPYPYRIITTLLIFVIVIFLPTNYFLMVLGKKLRWRVINSL